MVVTAGIAVFIDEVRSYCEFIARAGEMPLVQRKNMAREQLLRLYAAAISLPELPAAGDVEAGDNPERPTNWQGFGDDELYWEVFDPYREEAPVCGSLSDDLLDIYFDVYRGLALWDDGHHVEAIWEWWFSRDHHWGDHAVDALRALHTACNENALKLR